MRSGGLFTIVFLLAWRVCAMAGEVDYLKQIKPLLRERCYSCHGALKQKKELRLDSVAFMLKGGSDGPVLVRGEPERSLILKRVRSADVEERMPPEHEGQPFSADQIKLLSDWIAAGAAAPLDEKVETDPKDHWAFRPITRPAVPEAGDGAWVKNPIDGFVAEGHVGRGLTPQPEATREIQLRRLYLDLIGLPPTLEEIGLAETASGGWYEQAVDKLLHDPRHGERWARHWMDIWRYSDWYGLGDQLRSSQLHIWHWRDWIIQSINSDLPYDEMLRLMLAADELHPNDLDKLRATGLLARNYYLFNRNQWMDEVVEHVTKGVVGLTINCAKCHDHKYDPIQQTDFYQMRAFFEPYQVRLDVLPDEPDLTRNGLPVIFDGQMDAPTYRFIRGQESQPDKSVLMLPKPPQFLAFKDVTVQPVALPREAFEPERRPWVLDAYVRAARKKLNDTAPVAAKAKHALITALRQEAERLEASDVGQVREEVRLAVEDARLSFNVAEAAWHFAKASLASIEHRADAMRASWLAKEDPEKTVRAVKSEREAAVAKAQLTLAEAERRLAKADKEKKDAVTKEVKDAREALEKARQTARAPLKPEDKYTLLPGAKWSATRFLNSTVDDPNVEFPAQSTGRRTALADWITDRKNPLTARVAANHIWARHFGTPLVATVFDFGRKGAVPTHPDLLDWLAAELIESGWSMKHLHRLIVTSATYRMSSSLAGAEANVAKDPDNTGLWRRNPVRIEAEALRDSILALAGVLDPAMYGPAIPGQEQENSKRRSIYFFHSNNDRNLFLTTFDAAAVKECYRRDQSIVPQQALALSNSKLALDSAGLIAARLMESSQKFTPEEDEERFVRRAMSALLAIDATAPEVSACRRALEQWRKLEPEKPETARARLIWSLLNHNDFVTLR